jgi:hypothetical protein
VGEFIEATDVGIGIGGVDARAVEAQEEHALVLCGRDRLRALGLGGAHALDLLFTLARVIRFAGGVSGVDSGRGIFGDAGAEAKTEERD